MPTITSAFGNTPVGQQQQNFMDVLKSITGSVTPMSPQIAQQGQQSALSTQLALNQDQPAFEEQARQSLTQQSGIPQLQGQQADLSKLFELYLADSDLAGKYSATPTNPYSGGATNPYTGTPDEIVNAVTPTDTGAPGGGFTDPSMVTQAMGAPVSATKNIMDLVQKAIGVQEGKVKSKMGDVSANYQKSLSTLGVLANVFGDAYKEARDREKSDRDTKLETEVVEVGGRKVLVNTQTGATIRDLGSVSGIEDGAYGKEKANRTVQSVDELMKKVNGETVGWGSLLSGLPGTKSLNFKSELDTLKANIAFGELTAMREASKTGGALGQVSNIELGLLESSLGALNRAQSPEDFKVQLKKVKDSINRWQTATSGIQTKPSEQAAKSSGIVTQSDGTSWRKNSDGSYTRIK